MRTSEMTNLGTSPDLAGPIGLESRTSFYTGRCVWPYCSSSSDGSKRLTAENARQ